MTLPKHNNPTSQNAARAPYNFIPLPDVVVKAVESTEDLPNHDRYVDGRCTGHFEVTLTTKTPLYIRGGLSTKRLNDKTTSEYEQAEAEKSGKSSQDFRQAMKNKPGFFNTYNPDQPIIPGSSLRGMLRNLVEIITYSKMQWVTEKRLFFRTVDGSSIGKYYNMRMVEELGRTQIAGKPNAPVYSSRVRGGWLHQRTDGSYYIEECVIGRIEISDVLAALGLSDRSELYELDGKGLKSPDDKKNPNQTPKWAYQYQTITVDLDVVEQDYFFPKKTNRDGRMIHPDFYLRFQRAEKTAAAASTTSKKRRSGQLVLSGHVGSKHMASIFFKKQNPHFFDVPNDPNESDQNKRLIDRFHDEDQLTSWQQKAFPKDKPLGTNRGRDGFLEMGTPVFFLEENGQVVFLGRAQMFRLPYQQRPLDLIPPSLRHPDTIDFSEAMFGFVRTQDELKQMNPQPKQGSKGRAYAGRVFVGDGRYQPNQGSPWMSDAPDGIIEPHILATPKPTSFQLYLTQETPNDRKALHHYDSNANAGQQVTTLRGFKLYWAQGKKTADDLQAQPQPDKNSTQHTRMKPVASDKKFTFQVHFENLTAVELGALQWVLSVPNCHRLGMGKPLGMGVVQFDKPVLHLNSRSDRYKTLLDDNNGWNVGVPEPKQDFTADFETAFLQELRQYNVSVPNNFGGIERIKMLVAMLTWQERSPQTNQKEYMTDLNAFRYRPVLTDPLHLGGIAGSSGSSNHPGGNRPLHPSGDQSYSARQAQARPIPSQPAKQKVPQAKPTLREKTAVPTQFVSQLQAGDTLQGKVLFVEDETVYLEFPSLLNMTDKDVLGQIEASLFSGGLPEEGTVLSCKVNSIIEDDVEFTISCELIDTP